MNWTAIIIWLLAIVLVAILAKMSIKIVRQYEQGVLFRLGRVVAVRMPGLRFIIPVVDRLQLVSLRIVTMPIQSQGIITQDNVSVDISAVAYYRVIDCREVRRGDRRRGRGHQPDRPDHPAEGGRPPQPGPDAVGDRAHQQRHPDNPGRD